MKPVQGCPLCDDASRAQSQESLTSQYRMAMGLLTLWGLYDIADWLGARWREGAAS